VRTSRRNRFVKGLCDAGSVIWMHDPDRVAEPSNRFFFLPTHQPIQAGITEEELRLDVETPGSDGGRDGRRLKTLGEVLRFLLLEFPPGDVLQRPDDSDGLPRFVPDDEAAGGEVLVRPALSPKAEFVLPQCVS